MASRLAAPPMDAALDAEVRRSPTDQSRDPRADPRDGDGQSCFHQAIEIARRQKAKSFELRAVISLSKLYQKQGKHAVARDTLAEIYGLFTEGFETADLEDAAALLEGLGVEHDEESMRRNSVRGPVS